MSLDNQRRAVETIDRAFQAKAFNLGIMEHPALECMTEYYVYKALPFYRGDVSFNLIAGCLIWMALIFFMAHQHPLLVFAVLGALIYRTLHFRRHFIKTLRAHPDEVKQAAAFWCDKNWDRAEHKVNIVDFVDNKPISNGKVIGSFILLFIEINQEYTKQSAERFKTKFCSDQCDV